MITYDPPLLARAASGASAVKLGRGADRARAMGGACEFKQLCKRADEQDALLSAPFSAPITCHCFGGVPCSEPASGQVSCQARYVCFMSASSSPASRPTLGVGAVHQRLRAGARQAVSAQAVHRASLELLAGLPDPGGAERRRLTKAVLGDKRCHLHTIQTRAVAATPRTGGRGLYTTTKNSKIPHLAFLRCHT